MRRPSLRRARPRRPRRPPRRLVVAGLCVLAVAGGAFLLVRDAGFLHVDDVTVTGASGPDAPKVVSALEEAAEDMTILHVRNGALRDAVAAYPGVQDVEVERGFPRSLRLRVVERRPVGVAVLGSDRIPVAADGTLLRGATAADDLPVLAVENPGARVTDVRGRAVVRVAAAAPEPLRRRARRIYLGPQGLTVAMREGPRVVFGPGERPRAKWAAAARVLADPAAEGARSVDVRVPERPAATGLAPVATPEDEPSTSA